MACSEEVEDSIGNTSARGEEMNDDINELMRKWVVEGVYTSLVREVSEPDDWYKEGIHVNELIYDCLRRAYFARIIGGIYDMDSVIRMAIGSVIHAAISFPKGEKELRLECEGIRGSIDEYVSGIVIEKKTCRHTPKEPNEHHVKQAEYYAWLCTRTNHPVTGVVIVYVNVDTTEVVAFPITPRPIEIIEAEIIEKRDILRNALAAKVPPPRVVGWTCRYCPYVLPCFQEGEKK